MDRSALRSAGAHLLVEPGELDTDESFEPVDDVAHHLRRVLRLRSGETVGLTDGAGRWRVATVAAAGGRVRLHPVSPVHEEIPRAAPITIATAIPKGDRLDWLVQKVAELGVDRLVLLDCARSVVRWDEARAAKQLARLGRIAKEALRQSRGVWTLQIDGPVPAAEVLPAAIVAEPGGRCRCDGATTVAIGPEGGWSEAELAAAAGRLDLGPTVLRTETAAVTVAALCVASDR